MGNTSVRWMTLYRQERKAHQAEMEKLTQEYEEKLLVEQKKNKWLSDKLIETQKSNRVLTLEIAAKEVQISDLRQQLRRKAQLGRSLAKKTFAKTFVASSAGNSSGTCSE